MDGVRHVEAWRLRRNKLMNMSSIADDTLSMGYVEVTRDLVDEHCSGHTTALPVLRRGEGICSLTSALGGVGHDPRNTPASTLVRHL